MIKLNQLIYCKEFNNETTQRLLYAAGASDWLEQLLDIIKEQDEDGSWTDEDYETYRGKINAFLHFMEEEYPELVNDIYSKLSDVEKIELFVTHINEIIRNLNDKIENLKNRPFKVVHNGIVLPNAEVIYV